MSDRVNLDTAEQYAGLFATPQGQFVLRDLIAFCGLFKPAGDTIDVAALPRHEGRRDVILHVLNHCNFDLDETFVRKQIKESFSDHQKPDPYPKVLRS